MEATPRTNRSAKGGARSSLHYGGEGVLIHPPQQGVCGRHGTEDLSVTSGELSGSSGGTEGSDPISASEMGSSVSFSNSSDSGDWINAFGDSYNAFISQGEFASVSAADLDLMCAEGWNDRAACGTPATPTPEPATLALLGTSLLGFAAPRRRRSR